MRDFMYRLFRPKAYKAEKALLDQDTRTFVREACTFFDTLHKMYGAYHETPHLLPKHWYEPRRVYIGEMAQELFEWYKEEKYSVITSQKITPDMHPLTLLYYLKFPTMYDLQYRPIKEVTKSADRAFMLVQEALRDPKHKYHVVFDDLVPYEYDLGQLYDFFEFGEWQQVLEAKAGELRQLVIQEIAHSYTIIGIPPEGLPVYYEQPMHRYRHTLILGTIGAGKSTTITNLAAQDMAHGNGVIVMSPERNLFERIAPYIPQHRLDDVIYFDPRDAREPIIGFNPFFFEPPIDSEEYDNLEEYQYDYQMFRLDKASETYTIFERICRNLGVTMEPLLNYSMRALVGFPNATIRDFRKLLNPRDDTLRIAVCNDPSIDEATRDFWKAYARNSYYTKSYDALMNQLDKLMLPPIVDILSTHSFSFLEELNTKARILFLDLSTLSGIEAKVIAQLLIASIDKAILKRDKMPESSYIPYNFFIDEWQTYADIAGESLQEIALRLRKYHFSLTLANQVTASIPAQLRQEITSVCGTKICHQLGREDASHFAGVLMLKRPDRDSFNAEALQTLDTGQAYVMTPAQKSGIFVHIPPEPPGNLLKYPTTIADLKQRSKANFGLILKAQKSSTVDFDTSTQPVEEPEVRQATTQRDPEPPAPKAKPKSTSRRKRDRFDDDEEPLIDVH